jgi:hypothetical protein
MKHPALTYAGTLFVLTLAFEMYASVFHDQGIRRVLTGLVQALIYSGLAYASFRAGLRWCKAAESRLGSVFIYGALCWVIAERCFDYALSSGGPLIALGAVVVAIMAFSAFAGFKGGSFRRSALGASAN